MMADIAKAKRNVQRMIDGGASEREIDSYLASEGLSAAQLRGAKPNYTPPKRKMDTSANLQTLFTQGVTFGQSPRITGAMGTVMGIPDAIRQRSFDPLAEAYRQNRQAEIDRIDQARAQTGLAGMGMEALGGIATGGALARGIGQAVGRVAPNLAPRVAATLAPRAGSAGGKVARATGRTALAAGGGAASGAVYGSGEGRAVENALYGAVGGAAAEPIIRVGGATVRGARRLVGRDKTKPEVVAARKIVERLAPDAQARIDEAARLGLDPLSVVDVSRNSGKRMVRGVASASDGGQEIALNYRTQTREALPDRAQGIVRQMTGRDVDLAALRQQGDAALEAVDKANYGALEPVRVTIDAPLLDDLVTRQGGSAVRQSGLVSNTDRRFDDEAALGRVSDVLNTGQVGRATGESDVSVSLQALEDVYRIMRDRAAKMMADENPSATKREGFALMQEAERLGQSLAGRFPPIADARMASQQARQNIGAIDTGFNAFTPNRVPSELAADIGQLPARRNVLAGGQARLQQQIGENPLGALTALGFRPNMAARLNAMGAPTENMTRAAQIEVGRARTADFISPNTGSQTQLRATDMADIGGVPVTPMGWATKLMDFAFRRINAFTEAEMEALVRMGVEPADLANLQALAARDPDQIPSIVKGLIGSQVGIQSGNQSNAMARFPAGQ